jgi:hypothetical protein
MQKIKIAMWKRTYEFFKKLGNSKYKFGDIAKTSGKTTETAEAWGRPPESDEFPFGTGYRNPSDLQIRLLGLAYDVDPGFAREWAKIFVEYVDFLDSIHGKEHYENGRSARELCKRAAKEHADIVCEMLSKDYDPAIVWKEINQFESANKSFVECIKQELQARRNGGFPQSKAPQEVSKSLS